MSNEEVTDAELLVLGLVAEMPRHGYQLEQEIDARGMREWTPIGFSSIYFVLGKLESKRFVKAAKPAGTKSKKTYTITKSGQNALIQQARTALASVRPTHSSALLGMLHWPAFTKRMALDALRARRKSVQTEIERLENLRLDRQPLPDFVDAIFAFSLGQLRAEAQWTDDTLEYMQDWYRES